jgi:hypothetical protein
MKRPGRAIALASGVALLIGTVSYAQFGGGQGRPRGGGGGVEAILANTPYDGKFTFVRMRYGPPVGYASQRVFWSHDYPTGERNFMRILNELTYLAPHIQETNILSSAIPICSSIRLRHSASRAVFHPDRRGGCELSLALLKGGRHRGRFPRGALGY